MRRDPDTLNRLVLTLLGLALVVLGGWGVARGAGWLGVGPKESSLLYGDLRRFVARNAEWFWPVVALTGVVLALAGLFWLRQQFRAPRPASADLVVARQGGNTRVDAGGAVRALEHDLTNGIDHIRSASGRLFGDPSDANLDLRVEVADDADLIQVRRSIEDEVLPRFCRAVGVDQIHTALHLRLAPPSRQVR